MRILLCAETETTQEARTNKCLPWPAVERTRTEGLEEKTRKLVEDFRTCFRRYDKRTVFRYKAAFEAAFLVTKPSSELADSVSLNLQLLFTG